MIRITTGMLRNTKITCWLLTAAVASSAHAQCELAKIFTLDFGPGSEFGKAVDLCGDLAVIGAPQDGSAYVFRRQAGGVWTEEARFNLFNESFGNAVAIHGNRAIVGDDLWGGQNGAAYVYAFDGAQWAEEQMLTPDQGGGNFASAVALKGNFAVIGSNMADHQRMGIDRTGAAYLYRRDEERGLWQQIQEVFAPDPEKNACYGEHLAIDGDVVVISAPTKEELGEQSIGALYVYRLVDDVLTFEQKLLAPDGEEGDRFGRSVDVHGAVIIAGTDSHNPAYVFRHDGAVWCFEQILTAADFAPSFGSSVGVVGDTIVVCDERNDEMGNNAGAAYLFRFDGREWTERAKFFHSGASDTDYLGAACAVDGDFALIGADRDEGDDHESGTAYVFAIDGPDCDGDSDPDICELDCNHNGEPDDCEVADDPDVDCNANGVPDECDVQTTFEVRSGDLSPIGDGSPQSFVLMSPPPSEIEDVRLVFTASADLDSAGESIDIELNHLPLGEIFEQDGAACGDEPVVTTIFVPKTTYNNLVTDGYAAISMTATGSVDADECQPPSFISVTVEYAVPATSNDDNANGIPDECDIPGDFDGDGIVGPSDLLVLLGAWGPCDDCDNCHQDIIFDDCLVDTSDLLVLLGNWG